MSKKSFAALSLDTLRLEGALFVPDLLEKACLGTLSHQREQDYHLPKGLKLRDESSRAFQIAQAQWKSFAASCLRRDVNADTLTRLFLRELLHDALGYTDIQEVGQIELTERGYPISYLVSGRVPVVVARHTLGLDQPDPALAIAGSGARQKSAFQLGQEFLNAHHDSTWGLIANGRKIRLLRDTATLTRPSFLEFDIEDILSNERYADFTALWRILHASRSGRPNTPGAECVWEKWRIQGQDQGIRVRKGLRDGVTQALILLGTGFLQHPDNRDLRQALDTGYLRPDAYFQQLLRLVYRWIFLFTVEERKILHPPDDSRDATEARNIYAAGYAMRRLRDRSLRSIGFDLYDDLWQSVRIVFRGLAQGEPMLALPALGGLFAPEQCPDLDKSALTNRVLLTVMRDLRWSRTDGTFAPIDYGNMGPEELGSVYESLLELVPSLDLPARQLTFVGFDDSASTSGHARKLTGSYYTPDSLVQELLKTALDPVIDAKIAERPEYPVAALLSISLIDPACGSGHFLLAAARRLAERLAVLRAPDGAVQPEHFRRALRDVISRCIYGVDRNPMAIELARTALWLEGFEPGRPLFFLEHHLLCGDSLLGITEFAQLDQGISAAAFKALSGDHKEVCKQLAQENRLGLQSFTKYENGTGSLPLGVVSPLDKLRDLETLSNDTLDDVAQKARVYADFQDSVRQDRQAHAADLFVGAFLLPKTDVSAVKDVPTSRTLFHEMFRAGTTPEHDHRLAMAQRICRENRVLHWPITFAHILTQGGFDCVLGNPPWERIKLQEEEFFATRHPDVAAAKNKAERAERIELLAQGILFQHLHPRTNPDSKICDAERLLYSEFLQAKRTAESASVFAHLKTDEGGRFPLTGIGDVNTYALFAETISQITNTTGRAGFIVPSGIATDDSTKLFFAHITQHKKLVSLFDFENRAGIFPDIDSRIKFCLLTLGLSEEAEFAFFLLQTDELADSRRRFTLNADDFLRINPNTRTCPIFRSKRDAEITRNIYTRVPVLIRETSDGKSSTPSEGNPWGISFMRMFDMANDSHLFQEQNEDDVLPLYEAKMMHQFDHRWATYRNYDGTMVCEDVPLQDKQDPHVVVQPRYWVKSSEVYTRIARTGTTEPQCRRWLMGWRDICRATDERTVIASVLPLVAVNHKMPLIWTKAPVTKKYMGALFTNLNSLVLDYVARQKVGGTSLTYFYLKQFPVLPPESYTAKDLDFIVPRVLELTYTSHDLSGWAEDLGYEGEPFGFEPVRRGQLRAELDAYYARLYGLTRDELRYILDPTDVMGEDYPSETFRVLKNNEMKEFGEYRTQRLVLAAWDAMV